jgi:DNA-directed RNA polymerase subunit RPC12/RpoP
MRKSPVRHQVSSYDKENGKHVKPYIRGNYLPPIVAKSVRSIPQYFQDFNSLPPEEKVERYAMRLFGAYGGKKWLNDHEITQNVEYQITRTDAGLKLYEQVSMYLGEPLLRSLERQGLIKRQYDKAFITKRGEKFLESDYKWRMAYEEEPYKCIDCGKKIYEIDVKYGGHRCSSCDKKRFNNAISG